MNPLKRFSGLLAALFVSVLLSACISDSRVFEIIAIQGKPHVVILNGAEMDIGDGLTAEVFGTDQCDFSGRNGGGKERKGCIILTGRESATITMMSGTSQVKKEVWVILESAIAGGDSKRIRMARQGGQELKPVVLGSHVESGDPCIVDQDKKCRA